MIEPVAYSNNLGQYVEFARNIFNEHKGLLKWSEKSESIMDLGIGDGKISKEVFLPNIPTNIEEYVGCDLSPDMLRSSEKIMDHPNFQILLMDVTVTTIPSEMRNRFHHIFSNYVFHHVPNVRQAFVNIYAMLRPGGQLFFNAFAKLPQDDVYDIFDKGRWTKYDNWKSHSPFHDHDNPKQGYEDLAREIGFIDLHFFKETVTAYHKEESFEEFLSALDTRLTFVDEKDKKAYNEDFVEENKKTSFVKYVSADENGNKILSLTLELITGVVSKPNF